MTGSLKRISNQYSYDVDRQNARLPMCKLFKMQTDDKHKFDFFRTVGRCIDVLLTILC